MGAIPIPLFIGVVPIEKRKERRLKENEKTVYVTTKSNS